MNWYEYLLCRARTTYAQYSQFLKQCVKKEELLLLEILSVDVGSWKNLDISDLRISVQYSLSSAQFELLVDTTNYFSKNQTMSNSHHEASLFNTAQPARPNLTKVYAQYLTGTKPCLQLFMALEVQGQPDSSQLIKQFSRQSSIVWLRPKEHNHMLEKRYQEAQEAFCKSDSQAIECTRGLLWYWDAAAGTTSQESTFLKSSWAQKWRNFIFLISWAI